MIQPTIITWILIVFGAVFIFLPMLYVQLLMIFKPQSRRTKDIIIGKGEDWRDKTHFKMSYGFAWGDILIWLPLMEAGIIGVILGRPWGYVLLAASAFMSVYINIVLWFTEKEYVYPAFGPLAYYTYFWGFFVYWGVAAGVYSVLRLSGVVF